ncbi:M36 family metallopeptidase [Hymenobacter properus]|uniref:M36 family metallopeptidase n=1 Tax=Hymenobacter properus TaxID=2791026 RepID=A0A931FLC6_9BACT|nr:M36 family metallopeptidase [Hymenobacter properus]MBF9144043.1 M36 family metallopeptidase [Hymenobacter properus]MBR7722860.1 M36 family metallopeptidase [Microvirga sp. SRT04]
MLPNFRAALPYRFLLCAALLAGGPTAVAQPTAPAAPTASPDAVRALGYVRAHAGALGLSDADLSDLVVTGSYTDAHNGLRHVFLSQRINGHDVLGTEVGLHFSPTQTLLSRTGSFGKDLRAAASRLPQPAVGAEAARNAALQHLHQAATGTAQPAELVYRFLPNGTLAQAWQVRVRPAQGPDAWTVLVDAATGRALKARNQVIRENPKQASRFQPAGPGPVTPLLQPTVANGYRVYASPLESPLHGASTLAVNPADAVASPFGWHDTNGATGAEYTTARGNNTHVYTPVGAHVVTPGFSPDGGANLEFDFAHNAALSAQDNQPAALTNLFYWTNLMHDLSQRYGFTEASGNFQATNYSGQGQGGDYIRSQVGEVYSEGYFNTTPDGGATTNSYPEIVLGIWQMALPNVLTVAGTGPAAGSYSAMPLANGRPLPRTTPITGALVLANDGSTTPSSGCQPAWVNAAQVRGNIAVADFDYDCDFIEKLRGAQAAGARALVLVHSLDFLTHIELDPADTVGLRVPLVMVTHADGQRLKAAMRAGTPVTASLLGTTAPPDRNGGFDNGIIAHEYAHGITTRLTGGPAGATACLDNEEQMGEGWSDFFELWMTTRPGDVGTTARGIGTYVLGQATTGPGIRPVPYSTDMALNATTYAYIGHTVNNVNYGYDDFGYPYDSHYIGLVWCSVLWDLNWAMIQRYGYDANLSTGTGGNNKTMQLVMDGLKLQPCSPGFLDARDAILAADRADFGGANQALIWQVFARRGMGSNAVQGSSDDLLDNTAGFLTPTGLATAEALAAGAGFDLYPNPTRGQLTLRLAGASTAPVQVAVQSVLGQVVQAHTFTAAAAMAGATLDLHALTPGLYLVRVTTSAGTLTRRVVVQP